MIKHGEEVLKKKNLYSVTVKYTSLQEEMASPRYPEVLFTTSLTGLVSSQWPLMGDMFALEVCVCVCVCVCVRRWFVDCF